MKRAFLIVCMCVISLSCIFAEWQIGYYVDDFGDMTGDKFAYLIVDGTFSNTATRNSAAPTRVVANLSCSPTPFVSFTFEVHDYNFENPVNKFYSDTKSIIKVKDQANKVYTYESGKSRFFSTPWNELRNTEFIDLMEKNELLKIVLKAESSSYRFDIDTDNFMECMETLYEEMKKPLNEWHIEYYDANERSMHYELMKSYAEIGISKYFGDYSFRYYTKVEGTDQNYLCEFVFYPEDFIYNNYPQVNIYLYGWNSYEEFSLKRDSVKSVFKSVTFSDGKNSVTLENESSDLSYTDMNFTVSSYAKFKQICQSKVVTVSMEEANKGQLSFTLDGAGILETLDFIELNH